MQLDEQVLASTEKRMNDIGDKLRILTSEQVCCYLEARGPQRPCVLGNWGPG